MNGMFSRWANSTFAALSDRNFRILWIGTGLSFLAFMMQWIVQAIVAFDLTGKNGAVGFVGLGMGLATIVVSPFGGAIADRVSKRKLLLIGQTVVGANFLLVGALIITDLISIFWLAASTFVMGVVFSFIAPARQAWVGELLPRERIPNGIALTQVAQTATRIIGPFLAGLLVAISFIGTGGAYLFMGLIFVVVVATLAKLPPSKPADPDSSRSMLGDVRLGWRHLQERPRLQLLAYSFILVVITGYSYQVVMPGFLENELGRPSEQLWIILVVSSITGLGATIGLAGIAGSKWAWPTMLAGGGLLGLSLVLTSVAPNFVALLGCMLLMGAGTGMFQMLNNALVMRESEPAYYGRVMSLTMLAWGFNGLAGFPVGIMGDQLGERGATLVMGLAVLVVVAGASVIYAAINGRIPQPESTVIETAGAK